MRNVLLLSSLFLSAANSAFAAPVEADLLTGRRWAETKSDGEVNGTQMNEITFAGRYKVLDTGVSVGPSLSYARIDPKDLGDHMTGSNYELGLEAKYAYAVTPQLTPYAKARYIGYSKGQIKYDTDALGMNMDYRTYGTQLAIGGAYSLTPMVQLTAEVGYGVQMVRFTGGKVTHADDELGLVDESQKLPGSNREDFNSKSLMLGMNINL